jgi:hypothetical protein
VVDLERALEEVDLGRALEEVNFGSDSMEVDLEIALCMGDLDSTQEVQVH